MVLEGVDVTVHLGILNAERALLKHHHAVVDAHAVRLPAETADLFTAPGGARKT